VPARALAEGEARVHELAHASRAGSRAAARSPPARPGPGR
jgi:hypothetical protein